MQYVPRNIQPIRLKIRFLPFVIYAHVKVLVVIEHGFDLKSLILTRSQASMVHSSPLQIFFYRQVTPRHLHVSTAQALWHDEHGRCKYSYTCMPSQHASRSQIRVVHSTPSLAQMTLPNPIGKDPSRPPQEPVKKLVRFSQ